jgi:hypothetical protein
MLLCAKRQGVPTVSHSSAFIVRVVNSSLTVQNFWPVVFSLEWNTEIGNFEFSSFCFLNGFHQSVSFEEFHEESVLWEYIAYRKHRLAIDASLTAASYILSISNFIRCSGGRICLSILTSVKKKAKCEFVKRKLSRNLTNVSYGY